MEDFIPSTAFLVVAALTYIIFLRPKFEVKRNDLIFDSRAMGFLDALILSGMRFRCTDSEMRHYIENQLEQAHKLPRTETLITHTNKRGFTYRSRTGTHGDHILFVILCILQHAKEHDDNELLSWCEEKLEYGRTFSFNYSSNKNDL